MASWLSSDTMVPEDDPFARTALHRDSGSLSHGGASERDEEQSVFLEPGQCVGRFVLSSKLGEGGMGVVFIARDPELQRDVALKVLRRGAAGTDSTHAQQRMLREAQAMAMLSHPNLVAIYEVGTFQEHIFIAMEYVVGKTLDAWIDEGHHLEDVFEVFEQAGNALQAIHDAGLVHRDFKPANVLVTPDAVAKVLDLGIARKVGDRAEPQVDQTSSLIDGDRLPKTAFSATTNERMNDQSSIVPSTAPSSPSEPSFAGSSQVPPRESSSSSSPPSTGTDAFAENLTQDGALVGTPTYMSPEQLLSGVVGPATDQFAFAISLFEALTGYRPFAGETPVQVMANIIGGERRPWPGSSEVPDGVRVALDRALAKEPAERFSSMHELLRSLREGLGLRGQIRYLTSRWREGKDQKEYLLPNGSLLKEGLTLLETQPSALNAEQMEFIRSSAQAARRRRLTRRALVWGLGTVTVGFVPALLLLNRRSKQLELATQSEVQASIVAVREEVAPILARAREELLMMFDQRLTWEPLLQRLLDLAQQRTLVDESSLLAAVSALNGYFRPVVERIPIISSLMVASDEDMEYLAFRDPDAADLNPSYHFYNRFVRRRSLGDTAFQVFWPEGEAHAPRTGWLEKGKPDSRGRPWQGYYPSKRVWFQNAIDHPDGVVSWTHPYLFFVTKDAGVTGTIAWMRDGRRYVLAVDFMLTDLSLVTTRLQATDLVAAIVSQSDQCIALPRDPRFADAESVRNFFAFRNRPSETGSLDALANLPHVREVGPKELVAALRPYSLRSESYPFAFEGQELWAGRSPVGDPELGLTIYVVQRAGG